MNQFLEYLKQVHSTRYNPSHFCVVFEDYRWTEIAYLKEFDLNTLRKTIIGVAFYMSGEGYNGCGMWRVWFDDPFGGTRNASIWKMESAVKFISKHHNKLMNLKLLNEPHLPVGAGKEIGISGAGK